MTGPRFVEEIQDFMAPKTQACLAELPLCEMASLTEIQALGMAAAEAAAGAVFAAWGEILVTAAKELGLGCPCCGRRRKCKTRRTSSQRPPCAPSSTKATGRTSSTPSWRTSKVTSRRHYRPGSNKR